MLSVNIVARNAVDDKGLAKIFGIFQDCCCRDRHSLRLHIFGNAAGRDDFADVVAEEAHEVLHKHGIADIVAHDDVLQEHRVEYVALVGAYFALVQTDFAQTRQAAVLYEERQSLVAVGEVVKLQKLLVAERLDMYLLVSAAYYGCEFARKHLGV